MKRYVLILMITTLLMVCTGVIGCGGQHANKQAISTAAEPAKSQPAATEQSDTTNKMLNAIDRVTKGSADITYSSTARSPYTDVVRAVQCNGTATLNGSTADYKFTVQDESGPSTKTPYSTPTPAEVEKAVKSGKDAIKTFLSNASQVRLLGEEGTNYHIQVIPSSASWKSFDPPSELSFVPSYMGHGRVHPRDAGAFPVDIWVDKSTYMPTRLTLTASGSSSGYSLDVTIGITFSGF